MKGWVHGHFLSFIQKSLRTLNCPDEGANVRNDSRDSREGERRSPNSTVRNTGLPSFHPKRERGKLNSQYLCPALFTRNCRSGKGPNTDTGQWQVQESPASVGSPTRRLPPPILSWRLQIVHFISSYATALRRDSPEANRLVSWRLSQLQLLQSLLGCRHLPRCGALGGPAPRQAWFPRIRCRDRFLGYSLSLDRY